MDLAARGIERGELVPEVELLSAKMLPKRMAEYEIVSHWLGSLCFSQLIAQSPPFAHLGMIGWLPRLEARSSQ
jgi:hypothetical protein